MFHLEGRMEGRKGEMDGEREGERMEAGREGEEEEGGALQKSAPRYLVTDGPVHLLCRVL